MCGSVGSAVPVKSLDEGICRQEQGWKLVTPSPQRGAGEREMGKGGPSESGAHLLGLIHVTQAYPVLASIQFSIIAANV